MTVVFAETEAKSVLKSSLTEGTARETSQPDAAAFDAPRPERSALDRLPEVTALEETLPEEVEADSESNFGTLDSPSGPDGPVRTNGAKGFFVAHAWARMEARPDGAGASPEISAKSTTTLYPSLANLRNKMHKSKRASRGFLYKQGFKATITDITSSSSQNEERESPDQPTLP